jgi:putative spermidine/putrescine transport system permease protein
MKSPARLLFLFLLIVFIAIPLIYLLLSSFAGRWTFPGFIPQTWSLRAWRFIRKDHIALMKALGTSLSYSLASAFLSALMCWFPAQFLARNRFTGQGILEALLLAPALLPAISFSMGIQVMFIYMGLSDTFFSVVLILSLTSYPYILRSVKTGFLACSVQYSECAANLGAGRIQRLLQVEFPIVLPSVLSGAGIAFLVAFSEYFLVYLIGGGRIAGYTGYLVPFITGSDRAAASSLTLLFLPLPLLLFLFQELFLQRFYIRKGIELS